MANERQLTMCGRWIEAVTLGRAIAAILVPVTMLLAPVGASSGQERKRPLLPETMVDISLLSTCKFHLTGRFWRTASAILARRRQEADSGFGTLRPGRLVEWHLADRGICAGRPTALTLPWFRKGNTVLNCKFGTDVAVMACGRF